MLIFILLELSDMRGAGRVNETSLKGNFLC